MQCTINCCIAGPLHCSDIQDGGATESGVYTIRAGSQQVKVYCDLSTTDGGWTVRTVFYVLGIFYICHCLPYVVNMLTLMTFSVPGIASEN